MEAASAPAPRIETIILCMTAPSSVAPSTEVRLVRENCSVRFRHPRDDRHWRPILRRAHVDRDSLPRFQRASRPAGATEDARRAALARPFHFAALAVVDDDVQPGMRV